METIYIDSLICVNLFIDYIMLCLTKFILHINAKSRRILLSALIAGMSTLWVLLPIQSIFFSALYKIISTTAVILIAFGKCEFRKFTLRCLMYLGISMILSAVVTTLNLLYKPAGVFIYNDQLYIDISPTVLIISTAITYIAISIYQKLSARHKLNCRIYTITIVQGNDKNITFESALDTGCNLCEPFSNLPVILTESELVESINIPENKLRVIPYSTVSGSDTIYGFKPDKVQINGKTLNNGCYIGMCNQKLKGEVRSILGPRITEGL